MSAAPLSYVMRGHKGTILCAAFSADHRRLATGSSDGEVFVWDVELRRPIVRCTLRQPRVEEGADGTTEKGDGDDDAPARHQATTPDHNRSILSVGFESLEVVIVQQRNKRVMWVDVSAPTDHVRIIENYILHEVPCTSYSFCRVVVATDGVVFVPQEDSSVLLVDRRRKDSPDTDRIPPMCHVPTGALMCMCVDDVANEASNKVLAGFESGHVAVWHRSTSVWGTPLPQSREAVTAVQTSHSSHHLVCVGTADGVLGVYQMREVSATETALVPYVQLSLPKGVADVVFGPPSATGSRMMLYCAAWDKGLRAFDVERQLAEVMYSTEVAVGLTTVACAPAVPQRDDRAIATTDSVVTTRRCPRRRDEALLGKTRLVLCGGDEVYVWIV